ncbi:MAG TPA: DUF6291 domain-containing protein [Saprospiraceae bacterium]|nr:DUF6291 domain-containing protein [Saprospiraceae bacterium]
MKPSFIIHTDSLTILDKLTTEQKGILFDAIYKYHLGELVELDPLMDIVFTPFKNQFDRDLLKYKKVVDRNRLNGLKGGRPKDIDLQDDSNNPDKPKITQQNPSGLTETQDNPNNLDSDNDSVNDNDNDSDSDSEKDNKKESDLNRSEIPNSSSEHKIEKPILKQPKKTPQEEFDLRRADFRNSVYAYKDYFQESMLNSFLVYWGEKTIRGMKMRWETEKTFEIPLRLRKWQENQNKFNKPEERSLRSDLSKKY